MGIIEIIALSMGVAWASGISLYATLAVLGIMGATGHIALPPDLAILADPVVIAAACLMYCVEFFADKTPGVDTTWDGLHTFIRIPAGAVLATGAVGEVSAVAQVAALIVGGGLAATSHGLKTGTRVLINTSPEPVSNWTASGIEDVVVVGGLLAALYHPAAFIGLLGVFVIVAIWALPKLWRGILHAVGRLRRATGGGAGQAPTSAALFDPRLLRHVHGRGAE